MPATVLCGVSGWTRNDWTPAIFPAHPEQGFHPLEFLAERVDAIEIDQSFDAPIRPELARVWLMKVAHNARFQFTVQLGREFTHGRSLPPDAVKQFKEGLWPLYRARRLGALVMRFPWDFRFSKENRDFLVEVRRNFHEFPLVAELRHATWTYDEALGALIDHRIGFVNIDQPAAPAATPPRPFMTSPVGYVRLLGRGGSDWTSEAQAADYLYSPQELGGWQGRIDRIAEYTSSCIVIAANGAGGKGVVNAMQLRKATADPIRRPAGRVEAYAPARPVRRVA